MSIPKLMSEPVPDLTFINTCLHEQTHDFQFNWTEKNFKVYIKSKSVNTLTLA